MNLYKKKKNIEIQHLIYILFIIQPHAFIMWYLKKYVSAYTVLY